MESASKQKQRKGEISLAKKLIMAEMEKEFEKASYAFFTRFDCLSVADMNELRRNLEKVSRRTMVVKHSFVKKILEKMKLQADNLLQGSILLTLGIDEPQVVSKTLVDFAKGRESSVELKGLILDKKVYEANFVKELAKLPSRKELLTQVVVRFKSPIVAFAVTLNRLIQSLAIVLSEVQKKKAQTASTLTAAGAEASPSQAAAASASESPPAPGSFEASSSPPPS